MALQKTTVNVELARTMREAGGSWEAIARYFNVSSQTIKRHVDPEFRKQMKEKLLAAAKRRRKRPEVAAKMAVHSLNYYYRNREAIKARSREYKRRKREEQQ